MNLILSHSTARAYHRAAEGAMSAAPLPTRRSRLKTSCPDGALVRDARMRLVRCGVPGECVEVLEALVSSACSRRSSAGLICHVHTGEVPAGSILPLGGGVYVADARLCALQAAWDMSFRELVEYYYELCGCYALPLEDGAAYREREALASVSELARFFAAMAGCKGSALARRALRYVRDGARSPMETALVLTLALPKREGGLGIRNLSLNHRIEVGERARHLTRRSCFYCDVYLHRAKLDIEYHGFWHDDEARSTEDGERAAALRAMGYEVIWIRRWGFFQADAFRRFTSAVCRRARVWPGRMPEGFERAREDLRRFVLRRML